MGSLIATLKGEEKMKNKNHTITFDKDGLVKFNFTTDEIIEELKDDLGAGWDNLTSEEKRNEVCEIFLDMIDHDIKFYFKDMEF